MFRPIDTVVYYAIPDGPSGNNNVPELNFRGILDELGKDDEKVDITDDTTDEDDKHVKIKPPKDDELIVDDESDNDNEDDSDEKDELENIEDELNEPTEEQLELMTPARRRDILKEFPELFKKFPYLERAYYREQKYTELLPTLEDAQKAVDAAQTLSNFENDLLKGNTEGILNVIKNHDAELFASVVDSYLPTLAKVDEKAYYHVIGNVVRSISIAMTQQGNKSNNDTLKAGAELLNEFMFGSGEITSPTNLAKSDDTKKTNDDTLAKREVEFNNRRLTSTKNEVENKVNNSIKSTIEANIDPKDSMTPFIKKHAINEVLNETNKLISSDTRFKSIIDRLYQQAIKSDFSTESVSKIRSAYVSKARTLLPSVIKKARIEALRGSSSKRITTSQDDIEDDNDSTSSSNRTRNRSNNDNKGHSTSRNSGLKTDKDKARNLPKDMSSKDYLMSD